jgi:hypothetical protein
MRASCVVGRASAAALALSLSGCTFFGWLIGHGVDKNAKPKPVPPLQVARADKGQAIELVLRDGTNLAGRFDGLEPVPPTLYRERWKESLQALAPATPLPGLGPARLRTKKGSEGTVTLVGLRPGQLCFVEQGRAATETLSLESVGELGVPGGGSTDGAAFARLAQEGRLPYLDALALRTGDGGRRVVPLESVRSASIKNSHGARNGALIGALIDGILIAVAVSEASSTSGSSEPCTYCTSCPTVFSDGTHGLQLDAEPLGGSLFAADEARDLAPLARLEPRDGDYHVVVRNQMREVEHLDSVKLLVVDHAPASEVVPAMDGSLYEVRGAAAPRLALDATGANLAPQLARDDGQSWVEAPIGRDPESPASRRASAVLEFARPSGASSAVLRVAIRATDWGVALFGHVLELQGRELDSFWTRLEADASARGAFRSAWAREALPRIQMLTARGWRDVGTLAHIPLLVTGRRVVPLDLRDVEGDTLRLRIDALPGLWAIDQVAVAYGARPVSPAHTLSPRAARAEDGGDVLGLLAASDDRRLTLASMSGSVDLAFDAPARVADSERTVLIELEGYYRPLLPPSGEPQTALFERLVDEPGALARYALAGVDASTRRLAQLER